MRDASGYVIVANVAKADSCLRMGARVIVEWIPGNQDHVQVRGLTRGGRRVTKWVPSSRLTNMRVAWEYAPTWPTYETKEAAERVLIARFGSVLTKGDSNG